MAVLLEETRGFNDCEHLKELHHLRRVMFKTRDVKVGRGKKAFTKKEFVYDTDDDREVRENIMYSIKIFKDRCSDIESTNGK